MWVGSPQVVEKELELSKLTRERGDLMIERNKAVEQLQQNDATWKAAVLQAEQAAAEAKSEASKHRQTVPSHIIVSVP